MAGGLLVEAAACGAMLVCPWGFESSKQKGYPDSLRFGVMVGTEHFISTLESLTCFYLFIFTGHVIVLICLTLKAKFVFKMSSESFFDLHPLDKA